MLAETAGTGGLLILVPARGGSKSLRGKNALTLGDLPLLGWTASAVASSGLDGVLWLSTDDEEVATIGQRVGLQVPFLRPPELATDTATMVSVALHALDHYAALNGREAETLLLLQPTSPFRRPEALCQAMEWFAQTPELDAVLGVKAINRTLATLFYADAGGLLSPLATSNAFDSTRRQDVRTLYTPNGALYLVRTRVLREQGTFFPPRSRALVMDEIESLDIDQPTDWAIAEATERSGMHWRGPAR